MAGEGGVQALAVSPAPGPHLLFSVSTSMLRPALPGDPVASWALPEA